MLVFVYGTLTDPTTAHAVLDEVGVREEDSGAQPANAPTYTFAGPVTLDGLRRVDGRYPTLAPGGEVDGRLLAVDDAALERLDRYEGVDRGLYVRVAVPRSRDGKRYHTTDQKRRRDSEREPIWTYVGNPNRIGVDEPVTWPGNGPFERRVRRYVDEHDIAVVIDSG